MPIDPLSKIGYIPICQYCAYWIRHLPPITPTAATKYMSREHAGHCCCPKTVMGVAVRKDSLSMWRPDGDGDIKWQTGEDFGCVHYTLKKSNKAVYKQSQEAVKRQAVWDNIAQSYLDESYRPEEVKKSTWLVDNVLVKYDISSLVEIGCGTGRNLMMIKKKRKNISLWGLDICDRALAVAECRVPDTIFKKSSVYVLGSLFANQFDMALIVSVFMFVPPDDLQTAVNEVKRVARKYIMQVEWCREGVPNKHLTWNRNYFHAYEPEFKCIEMKSLAHTYINKDLPLMLWVHERV